MTKIRLLEDTEVAPDIVATYAGIAARHPLGVVSPIYSALNYNSDFFHAVRAASQAVHFKDGALTRAQHELIASYVSALNRCRY